MVTAADIVAKALEKKRETRYTGSVWRIGRRALTTVNGKLTDLGHAYLRLRPTEDLSHFDRATERITGRQVRAKDALGYERVVAKIQDGKTLATKVGQSYYGQGAAVFSAYVPAWRRDAQGNFVQTYISLDDQWLRLATGGAEAVSGLRTNVYSQDPKEVHRSIVEHLIRATRKGHRPPVCASPDGSLRPGRRHDGREQYGAAGRLR